MDFIPSYPIGYKLSHFRQARRLLLASSQAAGPLWEFRWAPTDGSSICLINRLTLKGVQIANATAEELRFNLKVARTFTAIDTTNVASILRNSGSMQELISKETDTMLSGFVESSGATAASGGTMTLDTDPIAIGSYVTLSTASTSNDGSEDIIFDFQPLAESGTFLQLRNNEGWTVNLEANKGATQGFVLYLEVAWTECKKLP